MYKAELEFDKFRQASNIVAILDLDGYMVDREFVPKELALKGLGDPEPFSCFFYNRKPFKDLSTKDQRTANWVYHNIFDIRYDKYWFGMLIPDAVHRILQVLKTPPDQEPWLVGYKGGHYERDLLNKLHIPSFNLELIGCPKVESITRTKSYRDCGYHKSKRLHCPAVEVQLFEEWFRKRMDEKQLNLKFRHFKINNPMIYLNNNDFAIKM